MFAKVDTSIFDIFSSFLKNGKNTPAVLETQAQSLGREDPLEKGMATLSRILAWEIPWAEEVGRLTVQEVTKSHTGLSN